MGELIVLARPLQTEKVVLFEVLAEPRIVAVIEAFLGRCRSDRRNEKRRSRIVLLQPVGVAKVAEEVFPSEVEEERVLVEEALLAELAERVAAVRGVVGVALPAVQRQVRPVVQPPLVREYLKNGRIQLNIIY